MRKPKKIQLTKDIKVAVMFPSDLVLMIDQDVVRHCSSRAQEVRRIVNGNYRPVESEAV